MGIPWVARSCPALSASIQGVSEMAKRVQIEFLSEGFHELLMSDEVAEQVADAAKRIADRATAEAGAVSKAKKERPQFVVKGPKAGGYGGGRVIAYVASENASAYTDQTRNARLESVIWGMAE